MSMTKKDFKELAEIIVNISADDSDINKFIPFCKKHNKDFDEDKFRAYIDELKKKRIEEALGIKDCINKDDGLLEVVGRGDNEKADKLIEESKKGKIIRIM